MKHRYIIGIDTGVNTGYAVWDRVEKKLLEVETLKIHKALKKVEGFYCLFGSEGVLVRVEDARKRKWFGGGDASYKSQGAGSVKRDSLVWEDFLKDLGADFEMLHPAKGLTKWSAEAFKSVTGWKERCSGHARDAAMLCYGK